MQVEKTAKMVGFEMPSEFDMSQKDEELKAAPRFTKVDPNATPATTEKYEELEAPEEPKKRTYIIPKAFGFAEQAKDDFGRPGDRKV